ncbi:MAG: phage major capsid protein [Bacillota bacterium]
MKLLEQIQAKEARMNAITTEIEAAESVEAVATLTAEYKALEEERSKLVEAYNVKPVVVTNPNPIDLRQASGGSGNGSIANDDPRATAEYRKAFQTYVRTGVMAPELRADATTQTTDIGALIPSTIMNRVIEELETYGNVYARITKSNIPGGVSIPISSLKPTASWVAEGSVSEKKKLTVTSKVTFGYFKLQIRISTTLEASVVSVGSFEQLIAKNLVRAIVKAIEDAVFNGTGVDQPTGLLVDARIVAGQKISFAATDATYDGWVKKLIASIKNAYSTQSGNAIYMNKSTWDTYVSAMVDTNKQPVARLTIGLSGKQERVFLGYPVEIVDYLPTLDAAVAGNVFLVFGDLSEFVLNSNLQLTYKKYFDEATDEWIEKTTLIADGKVADAAGFVMLKKAA